MADALDSKSNDRKVVRVRLPPRAQRFWYTVPMSNTKSLYAIPVTLASFLIHDEEPKPFKHPNDAFLNEYFEKIYCNFETRLARLKQVEHVSDAEEVGLKEMLRMLIEAKKMTEEE